MAAATKFQSFAEAVYEKAHNLGSDTLKVLLALSAPSAANDAAKTDLTDELGTSGGYTSGGNTITITGSSQSGGTYSLVGNDSVFTASGGTIGPFRYAVLWNDTSSTDLLIQMWDYGSSVTLADTETFTVDFGSSILTHA